MFLFRFKNGNMGIANLSPPFQPTMTRPRQAPACPACGSSKGGNVIETQPLPDGTFVRLRVCKDCGEDFKTSEKATGEIRVGYLRSQLGRKRK